MSDQPSDQDFAIGTQFVEAYKAYGEASRVFLDEVADRVSLLRTMLRGRDRLAAIAILPCLREPELIALFDDLIFLASFSHGAIAAVRSAIGSLPRDWVVSHMEAAAEPYLREGTYDEYRRVLELFAQINHQAAERLAHRALAHPDKDIREAGADFLLKLKPGAA